MTNLRSGCILELMLLTSLSSITEFEKQQKLWPQSVLFVKQQGCEFCEVAALELTNIVSDKQFSNIHFFTIDIEKSPEVPGQLAILGVPAFLAINSLGHRRIQSGFVNRQQFLQFLEKVFGLTPF